MEECYSSGRVRDLKYGDHPVPIMKLILKETQVVTATSSSA